MSHPYPSRERQEGKAFYYSLLSHSERSEESYPQAKTSKA
jgi:hypothetical protein